MSTTSLAEAVHAGDRAGVRALLLEGGSPNQRDEQGWTPLLYAVVAADQAIVADLIGAGADVNAAAPDGATPLMKAVLWGQTGIVRALLDAGADPLQRDRAGWSAMDIADAGRHSDVRNLLQVSLPRARRNAS
jgi:ankyrin repeat protein